MHASLDETLKVLDCFALKQLHHLSHAHFVQDNLGYRSMESARWN